MPRRTAGLDVGTNSIKIAVGEFSGDGRMEIVYDASEVVKLGQGIGASGTLNSEAVERALAAISREVEAARSLDVDAIRAVGTSAVRESDNGSQFIDLVREKTGVEIEIISGHDEAELSYQAIVLDNKLGSFSGSQVVVDIGGGSTELIFGDRGGLSNSGSVRIGALKLTEKFLRSDDGRMFELEAASEFAENMLRSSCENVKVDRAVGIGGTVVNLARVWKELPAERTPEVHGAVIGYQDIRGMTSEMCALSSEERKKLPGLEPERADTIIGGAVILERVLAIAEAREMVVSIRGLRHALVYELLTGYEH